MSRRESREAAVKIIFQNTKITPSLSCDFSFEVEHWQKVTVANAIKPKDFNL